MNDPEVARVGAVCDKAFAICWELQKRFAPLGARDFKTQNERKREARTYPLETIVRHERELRSLGDDFHILHQQVRRGPHC
jgi:hypothetical protein